MARLAIIGGGGLVAEIIETAHMCGHEIVGVFAQESRLAEYPLLGRPEDLPAMRERFDAVHLAIGAVNARSVAVRRRMIDLIRRNGLKAQTIVSPEAWLGSGVELGEGVYVGHRALISCGAWIGDFVSINHNAVIGHDTRIEENASIAPLVFLGGDVKIGEDTMLGVRSTIRQGLEVGAKAVVGMGSLVIKSVPEGATVLQMPSRIYREDA